MASATEVNQGWEGDVLSRKPVGDFLYRLTTQRYEAYHSAPGGGALCFALDAEWGAGKTFFVRRWAEDIAAQQHPVVHFDAWANDLSDDPLLGFMAELQTSIGPWVEQLPVAKKVKSAAASRLKHVMRQAPRAVMPVLSVLTKGLLKKVAAVDTDEIIKAVTTGDTEGVEIEAPNELAVQGLEKFFEVALKSHSDRRTAISALKRSIEDLLEYLAKHAQVRLPLFVFIDELDRCRPDYAIRLLEGIKHLFDAQGVCFVCSTNLVQLAASAQAVYGTGFDAYRYLKRFFAFEYRLPEPNHTAYARLLTQESVLAKRSLGFQSARAESMPGSEEVLAGDFALIASALRLDLRSQKQVFRLAEAASSGLADGQPMYCLYMFFLAAVFQKGAKLFDALADNFADTLNRLELDNIDVGFSTHDDRGRLVKRTTKVRTLIELYEGVSRLTPRKLQEAIASSGSGEYPNSLKWTVYQEINGRRLPEGARLSLSDYYDLVRAGGQVVSR